MTNHPDGTPIIGVIVCGLIVAISIFSILKPQATADSVGKWYATSMRMLGYEVQIKSTPKAAKILRIYNLCWLAALIVIALLALNGSK